MSPTTSRSTETLVWIVPKWPFPANDGSRQATTQLIRSLTKSGISLLLVCIAPTSEQPNESEIQRATLELGVKKITIVARPPSSILQRLISTFLNPFIPLTIAPYTSFETSSAVAKILATNAHGALVYDGLHAAAWCWKYNHFNGSTFYRAHNVESDIWRRLAKSTHKIYLKPYLYFQAQLVGHFEKAVSKNATAVFPVSDDDAAIFRKLSPHVKSVPIGISKDTKPKDSSAINQDNSNGLSLLFVGRLDWPPNRDGLRWFLDKVWPAVMQKRPDSKLTIVGSGNGHWVKSYESEPGIEFKGKVPDVTPEYERSDATIVPIFYGSGTRVKAIESSLLGRVCISTELGVEGVGLESGKTYLLAENESDWIETIVKLDKKQASEMGSLAQEVSSVKFDPHRIAQSFIHYTRERGVSI